MRQKYFVTEKHYSGMLAAAVHHLALLVVFMPVCVTFSYNKVCFEASSHIT